MFLPAPERGTRPHAEIPQEEAASNLSGDQQGLLGRATPRAVRGCICRPWRSRRGQLGTGPPPHCLATAPLCLLALLAWLEMGQPQPRFSRKQLWNGLSMQRVLQLPGGI